MKKASISGLLLILTVSLFAQFHNAEDRWIDSLLRTGKLTAPQSSGLYSTWVNMKFPEAVVNSISGEIEISDILDFTGIEKKNIYNRCLEWIAMNYGNLAYSDLESGKIISNNLVNLTVYEPLFQGYSQAGYDVIRRVHKIQVPVNYTLVITLRETRIKYAVTNLIYNFVDDPETMESVPYPAFSVLLDRNSAEGWLRRLSALIASREMFSYTIKNSLTGYIRDYKNDYNF